MNRDEAVAAIRQRTGKTREQAEAFLDILGSAMTRRGWASGAVLTSEQVSERLDTFIGAQSPDVEPGR